MKLLVQAIYLPDATLSAHPTACSAYSRGSISGFAILQGVSWKVRFTRGGQKFVIPVSDFLVFKDPFVQSGAGFGKIIFLQYYPDNVVECDVFEQHYLGNIVNDIMQNLPEKIMVCARNIQSQAEELIFSCLCVKPDYALHNIESVYSYWSFNNSIIHLCYSKGTLSFRLI